MLIAAIGIGVLVLFAGIILFADRKGDREFKASRSYVRERAWK